MHTLTIMLSLIACTIIIGCGKQTGDSNTDNQHGDGSTVTTQAGNEIRLPKNFPNDVYIHPNTTIFNAYTTSESSTVGFDTEDTVKTVAEQYIANMLKSGWNKTTILDQPEISMLSFSKKERTANVIISSDDEKTQITITLTAAPAL